MTNSRVLEPNIPIMTNGLSAAKNEDFLKNFLKKMALAKATVSIWEFTAILLWFYFEFNDE